MDDKLKKKTTQNQILSHSTTESFRLIKVAKSQKVFSISFHLQNSRCQLYPLNTGYNFSESPFCSLFHKKMNGNSTWCKVHIFWEEISLLLLMLLNNVKTKRGLLRKPQLWKNMSKFSLKWWTKVTFWKLITCSESLQIVKVG